jgi:hypothetical protein
MKRSSMKSYSTINTIVFTTPGYGAGETNSIADFGNRIADGPLPFPSPLPTVRQEGEGGVRGR